MLNYFKIYKKLLFVRFIIIVKPHFMQLANIWIGFQDELVLISVLSNVLYNLEPFAMVRYSYYLINLILAYKCLNIQTESSSNFK